MEPFPELPEEEETTTTQQQHGTQHVSSTRLRQASLRFLESNPPSGAWMATGEIASHAPTLPEIRHGSFSAHGWTEEGQLERRGTAPQEIQRRKLTRSSSFAPPPPPPPRLSPQRSAPSAPLESLQETTHDRPPPPPSPTPESSRAQWPMQKKEEEEEKEKEKEGEEEEEEEKEEEDREAIPDESGTYPNGYRFPPKHSWQQSVVVGLQAFGRFTLTPFGFVVTIYCLNIVAWGAMIFFLLLNAAPAMCNPSCDDDYSARQIWIEIDSQILNALFCVTGFGLIPWRFRDLYYLLKWRVGKSHDALRRLAGVHRSWFRLPGSEMLRDDIGPPPVYLPDSTPHKTETKLRPDYTHSQLESLQRNPAVPLPIASIPPAPLTGNRATPTKPYLLDALVWLYALNTFFQAGLAGLEWGMNRFERPTWAVAFTIAMGCGSSAVAGWIAFQQGRRVKNTEGVPVLEEDPSGKKNPAGQEEKMVGTGDTSEQKEEGTSVKLFRTNSNWYQRH